MFGNWFLKQFFFFTKKTHLINIKHKFFLIENKMILNNIF